MQAAPLSARHEAGAAAVESAANFSLEGLIRDERGVRVAPANDD
jgi:hypothetical protein